MSLWSALARRWRGVERSAVWPLELYAPEVFRGFVPRSDLLRLKRFVERVYDEIEDEITDWSLREDVRTAYKWGGLSVAHLRERSLVTDGLLAPITERLAARWRGAGLIPEVSAFRRILPDRSTYIYWHMDADGTGSYSYDPVWNCWLPLEDVGVQYPSLELLVHSEAYMRRQPLREGRYAERSEEWVAKHFPDAVPWSPVMEMGDALVFSHYILHRTQPMVALKGPRIGAELRFTIG